MEKKDTTYLQNKMKEEIQEKNKFEIQNNKKFSIKRIVQSDIPTNKKILVGLTYIKGISWAFSNAICKILNLNPTEKIESLNKQNIEKIENFLKKTDSKIPKYLLNRRKDFETGEDSHLIGNDLNMKKEFDIRRLKKIRSYRGLRHAFGHPSRGQRTKSNFRSKGKKKTVGVKTKKRGK